ncbi:hypothetical protein RF55_15700 [Lasius niger]|uniref:Uncharacterized protein n=1 Tax=Lasius niger TaxID=67767 RepID=A0A0J7K614_LASNI|nr:hypothetical protein RF55_15700 [Lasius niger]
MERVEEESDGVESEEEEERTEDEVEDEREERREKERKREDVTRKEEEVGGKGKAGGSEGGKGRRAVTRDKIEEAKGNERRESRKKEVKEGGSGEGEGLEKKGIEGEREEGSWSNSTEEEEEEDAVKEVWKRVKGRIDEERRRDEREGTRGVIGKREERVRRERRRRSLVWTGIEGDSFEERCGCLRGRLEMVLGRKVGLRGVEERFGEGGKKILLVVMEKEKDRDEVLGREGEIWGRWRMNVDEDLTKEERKMKWRIKEKAKIERSKGNWVVFDSRRLWIEDRVWKWDEEKEVWEEGEGE